MTQTNRLQSGGLIDRTEPIHFSFNGRRMSGYSGDTLASALLANDVHLVARSFKYHRPRGILSAGSEEPNALFQLSPGGNRTDPNCRATEVPLQSGIVASSQNCWPDVRLDIGALNNLFSRLLPAGFYNKTFMWPAAFWEPVYERLIRKSAGMGTAPNHPDPDIYANRNAHCDVLVVGGGPAGLAAALRSARTGARVILADEQNIFGGQLLSISPQDGQADALAWRDSILDELASLPDVTLLNNTTIAGYYDYNYLTGLQRLPDTFGASEPHSAPRQRFWKIRAREVVLATGSIERPLVFANNDLPGIMLSGAVKTYINRYGVLPGKRTLVATNNDSAYETAFAIREAGGEVTVADARVDLDKNIADRCDASGIPVILNSALTAAFGWHRVWAAGIGQLSQDRASIQGREQKIPCDLVAVSGGWMPSVHLHSQARGAVSFRDDISAFVPDGDVEINPHLNAGACLGVFAPDDCARSGWEAGATAVGRAGFEVSPKGLSFPDGIKALCGEPHPVWITPVHSGSRLRRKKWFHEFQHDSTLSDLQLAAREGYSSAEHLKRYTTTGMGTDQGKTSNLNALTVLADIRRETIPAVGATTFRPPYTPVTFGAIAGLRRHDLFEQERKTPMHDWHVANGAEFECVGDWLRAHYYCKPDEDMHAAVQRECRAVRESVGMVDASTLGKIDIQGPDAAEFLNRIYTNAWTRLGVGKCRYGLMLNEQGMVLDDGVTTRLDENHFHMTTTTGGAGTVFNWLEEWLQTEWPDLEVYCTSVTEQWAVAALNGPRSRDLLQGLTDADLGPDALPFMSMTEATVAGIPARIFRISFTGELAYEINVPARFGLALWEAIVERGAQLDLCVYGTEALHVLRAEKGFIIVGQDTDGTVTPLDLGMDWIVSKKKPDYLGKRSLTRPDTSRSDRKHLVGLYTERPQRVLQEGAQLTELHEAKAPANTVGHVTSSYMSPNMGRSIALALLENGRSRHGDTLKAFGLNGTTERVTVTAPLFYDPEGRRVHD